MFSCSDRPRLLPEALVKQVKVIKVKVKVKDSRKLMYAVWQFLLALLQLFSLINWMVSNSPVLHSSIMLTLQDWDTPKGSAWCTNIALASICRCCNDGKCHLLVAYPPHRFLFELYKCIYLIISSLKYTYIIKVHCMGPAVQFRWFPIQFSNNKQIYIY